MGKIRSIIDSSSIKPNMKVALENEARKMVAKQSYSLARDLTAIILYTLHIKYGWGKKRLLRVYNEAMPLVQELKDHYEMQDMDAAPFLCSVKLKDLTGIDMEKIDFQSKLEVEIK